ncbi:MAG: DUF2182 domain-containing protein [Ardenticatenaceae bacterium]
MLSQATHHRFPTTLIVTLCLLAWLLLWLWGRSPYARFLSHHSLEAVRGGGLLMLVFVAGWLLMTVAMMLPTVLPLVMLFSTITRRRSDRRWLAGLLLAGYTGVWTLVGVVVYGGDWIIHAAAEEIHWLHHNAWVLAGVTVVLAGVYQFTPLKYHCLDKCRSPLSFVSEHWRGRRERLHALWLGIHHGLYCIGCCWSLMLLMFAVGVGNLGWMLALGTVMAVEKNASWGRRISAPLGVILVGWGVFILLAPLSGPAQPHVH